MVVAASNWTSEDHMLLLLCIHDSMDVSMLGAVMDSLDSSSLLLPMGKQYTTGGKHNIPRGLNILYHGGKEYTTAISCVALLCICSTCEALGVSSAWFLCTVEPYLGERPG